MDVSKVFLHKRGMRQFETNLNNLYCFLIYK